MPRLSRRAIESIVGGREAPLGERIIRISTAVILAAGFLLRMRGYLWQPSAFWLDECSWAMLTVELPLAELAIRPVGFMWLSRLLGTHIALTEPVLRFVPWLAGMTTVALSPSLARRLFVNPAARLLFVAIIAFHPAAIDFSKEFKPYSCSLMLHLLLVLLALRYVDTRRSRDLGWLLFAATLGGLFAQDLLFAYPGVFLLASYTALRERRRQLLPIFGVAALIIGLIAFQYFWSWNQMRPSDRDVWASKYNVFYAGHHSYAAWLLERHTGMAAFPGFRAKFWQASWLSERQVGLLRSVDATVWLCLHVLGIVVLLGWRQKRALLLVLPVVVLWTFNFLRLWPIGAFRTNLFVVGYVSAIACTALDGPLGVFGRLRDVVPALLLVVAPFLLFDRDWNAHKHALTHSSEFPRLLKGLLRAKAATDGPGREPLVLDRRSCDPFRYYTEFHPTVSKQVGAALRRSFDTTCVPEEAPYRHVLLRAIQRAPHHAWTILHTSQPVRTMMRRHQLGGAVLGVEEHFGQHTVMAFSRASDANARGADAGEVREPPHVDEEPEEGP
jgi:hypothetical protein